MLYFVYILASKRNGTLYIGVCNDIARRSWEHKEKRSEGFTQKYGVTTLVYYEMHEDIRDAISCAKQLKKWHRTWKTRLIESADIQIKKVERVIEIIVCASVEWRCPPSGPAIAQSVVM